MESPGWVIYITRYRASEETNPDGYVNIRTFAKVEMVEPRVPHEHATAR